MRKLILGLLIFGLTSQLNAQVIELEAVELTAVNYKYLNAVDSKEVPVPVKMLQQKVAEFDLKNAEFYTDEYDLYEVRFFIPEGKILAAYNKDGVIIRTAERFKNVKLPEMVRFAVADRYPGWEIEKDVYRVDYYDGDSNRQWKVVLTKGDKKKRVKLDGYGKFLK
ncbi:MAG: nicotinate-nucleotide adenylyltransferase [Flavobacteriaceae bacterium]|nr:nicotinate-nucleotide adenylyltransferase [Bacteroidia bacterium]NNK88574.1 nicotinate-nucleotide adenylyltransferase [Flavobacteriaceae bacterium]